MVMCALVVATWFAGLPPAAADNDSRPLQLEVFINDTPTDRIGTFALLADQKLAATRGELAELGVNAPGNGAAEDTIVIDAASGIEYRYDEPSQRIYFKLGDERRVRQQYDARGNVDAAVQPKPDFGAVMNYTLFGGVTKSFGPGFTGFSGANASLDTRVFGPYGTLTQTGIVGSTTLRDMDVLRLDTRWTYSDPDNLVSYRAGDTISGGLAWTRPIRLGGLQVQRNFALRPDLVTLPLPSYSGSAAVPSTVDVYVNNIKALSQPVAAGPYQISNLPLLAGGGTARVVMQDAAGREVEASLPFFISPTLLRQGLTDYTLEAGFPRLNYATQSNDYLGKPAASGGVRHGLSDWLTLEAHGEAGAGVLNAGSGAVASLASWGVISVAASASRFDERFGFQGYAAFDTQLWGVTVHAGSQRTFGAYNDLSSAISRYLPLHASVLGSFLQGTSDRSLSARPPKALDTVSVGIPLPFDKSSLNFSFIRLEMYDRKRSEIMNVSYSRPLIWDATVHVTAFTDLADRKNSGIFAGISVPLGEQISGGSGVNSTGGRTNGYVDIAKTMQPEPGSYGWRVRDAEEVAERHLDRRRRFAVPPAAQDRVAIVGQLGERERAVDVRDAAGTLGVEQLHRLTRADDDEVGVAPAAVPGGGAETAGGRRDTQRAQRMVGEGVIGHRAPGHMEDASIWVSLRGGSVRAERVSTLLRDAQHERHFFAVRCARVWSSRASSKRSTARQK